MCVIIDNSDGHSIDEAKLLQATRINPHGFGIIDLDTNKVSRTMDMRKALGLMKKTDKWIAHCRFATVGSKSVPNCHPYKIGDGWHLMMNGTVQINTRGKESDTKTVAKLLTKIDVEHWKFTLDLLPARFLVWKQGEEPIITGSGWLKEDGVLFSKKIQVPKQRRRRIQVSEFSRFDDLEPSDQMPLFSDNHNSWRDY